MTKKDETLFKDKIMPELKKLGYFVKIQQVAIAGTPDILGTISGVFIALELKTDTGSASKLQKLNIARIIKNGGIALEVSPSTYPKVKKLLVTLKKSYQVKQSRKYLLKLLQAHNLETDK